MQTLHIFHIFSYGKFFFPGNLNFQNKNIVLQVFAISFVVIDKLRCTKLYYSFPYYALSIKILYNILHYKQKARSMQSLFKNCFRKRTAKAAYLN